MPGSLSWDTGLGRDSCSRGTGGCQGWQGQERNTGRGKGRLSWKMGLGRDSSGRGDDPEASSTYRVHSMVRSYARLLGIGFLALLALAVWSNMMPPPGEGMAWDGPPLGNSNAPNPSNSPPANSSGEIHVFFHIFRRPEPEMRARVDEIIREQQAALRESGVEEAAAAVHYTVLGLRWEELVLEPNSVYRKTSASGPEGSEGATLQLIWEHCKQAPWDRVLYIHTKGSFQVLDGLNDRFRRALMHSVLDPCCLDAISSKKEVGGRQGRGGRTSSEGLDDAMYDVCGMRYSAFPYIAFHGNMWWARCDYIQRLIPPDQFRDTMDKVGKTVYRGDPQEVEKAPWLRALGRAAFEHWVGSHPSLRAADNLPFGLDPGNATFLSGHDNIPDTSAHPWKPICSCAPRAEIPLATLLGDVIATSHFFPFYPLPSLQWKEYGFLYGKGPLSAMRRMKKENSVPSICLWWGRFGALQDAELLASLSAFVTQHAGLEKYLKDWLHDYKSHSLQWRCQSCPSCRGAFVLN